MNEIRHVQVEAYRIIPSPFMSQGIFKVLAHADDLLHERRIVAGDLRQLLLLLLHPVHEITEL